MYLTQARLWCLGGPQQIVLNHAWGAPKARRSTNDPPLPPLQGHVEIWGRNEGVVWGMQSGLLDPGAGSGYRGLSAGAGGLLSWGRLSFHVSAAIWSLCCHGHTDPLPPPSPSLDALPFSQCPPHATRVPETQFQMSGVVPQFGHRRGPASVWAPAAGWGTPRWAGSELFENWTVLFFHPPPRSAPAAGSTAIRTGLGPQQGLFWKGSSCSQPLPCAWPWRSSA